MAKPSASERAFNEAYCARVKRARETSGKTQREVATALDIPKDRYIKYEKRSPLPPYLIERFAIVVGKSPLWVLTGNSRANRVHGMRTALSAAAE